MAQQITFNAADCEYMYALDESVYTSGKAAEDLNALNWRYVDGVLTMMLPENLLLATIAANTYAPDQEGTLVATAVGSCYVYTSDMYAPDADSLAEMQQAGVVVEKLEAGGVEYSWTLTEEQKNEVKLFSVNLYLEDAENGQGGLLSLTGSALLQESETDEGEDTENETAKTPEYVYPTGTISIKELPVTNVGFKHHQDQESYSHIRIVVAEIHDDTVGGEGHVWQSGPYEKDVDYLTTVEAIRGMCEGKEITHFNVEYLFLTTTEEGTLEFVGSHIVGGATNVQTFSVTDEVKKSPINLESTAYCLDPVLLTVNRQENREIQHVTVDLAGYHANFEFYPDRHILDIDLAAYLQALFANVDLFEYQSLVSTVVVKLYNQDWELLETQGITVTAIYGKNPDPALPKCKLRVQWLDKYGYLHDEYFKIVDNQTEGESLQKYVVSREEREDKTGEKSITLGYVLANNSQKEALKTLVFSDHVRAYIGESWRRVKVVNTYKTGKGREKQNFEFTIKYSL